MQRILFLPFLCALLALPLQRSQAEDTLTGVRTRAEIFAQVTAMTALGKRLFSDPALSASGTLSCASCHSPEHAFGPPNDRAVQLGGADMQQQGVRAVPSLRYLQVVPQFTEHYFESEDEADESVDNGPTGGLTWDGRADRGADQARLPLLSPLEMANATPADVVAKAAQRGYDTDLVAIFGDGVMGDTETIFRALLKSLETYEQDAADFYPYSSKYDAYLAGKTPLTAQEARGLKLFEEPEKGNCAHCHVSQRGGDGTPPQFTDYGMIALGVPRNKDITANNDAQYFDLGLCGPYRTDLADHPDYCGLFKTPSLRNVATRGSFFHNGVLHSLREAVEFYADRDTNPEKWYPRRADGSIAKFDDLPSTYWANLNDEPPFDEHHPGDPPVLSSNEIDDIVAFLNTLTDGYQPTDAAGTHD